jgi:hypothetical protein
MKTVHCFSAENVLQNVFADVRLKLGIQSAYQHCGRRFGATNRVGGHLPLASSTELLTIPVQERAEAET